VLGRQAQINHAELASVLNPYRLSTLPSALPRLWDIGGSTGALALNGEVTRQALMIGYLDDFRLMMYMTLLAVPLLLLMRPPKRVPGPSPA